jgi:hypothetical protein
MLQMRQYAAHALIRIMKQRSCSTNRDQDHAILKAVSPRSGPSNEEAAAPTTIRRKL